VVLNAYINVQQSNEWIKSDRRKEKLIMGVNQRMNEWMNE
jgi:hypothetical protein